MLLQWLGQSAAKWLEGVTKLQVHYCLYSPLSIRLLKAQRARKSSSAASLFVCSSLSDKDCDDSLRNTASGTALRPLLSLVRLLSPVVMALLGYNSSNANLFCICVCIYVFFGPYIVEDRLKRMTACKFFRSVTLPHFIAAKSA